VIVRFRASGRVQGVGYRAFAQGQAQALGLAGWVRNDPDGAVSGEAQGSPEQLAIYRRILKDGPPWGRVDGLAWSEVDDATVGAVDEGAGLASQSLPRPFQIRR
jgi:acylphosphatase